VVTLVLPLLKLPTLLRKPAPPPPRDRFRPAVEHAPLGIAIVGSDGAWLHFNDRLGEIVGYTREQLRNLTFNDITHHDDARREATFLRRLRAGDIPRYRIEKRVVDRRGRTREIVVAATLVRDARSNTPDFFVFVVDDAPMPPEPVVVEKPSAQDRAFLEQARVNAETHGRELKRTIGELRGELERTYSQLEEKTGELRIMANALRMEMQRRKAAERALLEEKLSASAIDALVHLAEEFENEIEIPPPPPPRPPATELLVAGPVAKKFHRMSCGSARRLDEETRIMFTSVADAMNAGYAACRLCGAV